MFHAYLYIRLFWRVAKALRRLRSYPKQDKLKVHRNDEGHS